MTQLATLTVEALVVALVLVLIFFLVHMGFMAVYRDAAMTNHALLAVQVAIAGAAFHVLFEITGLNAWYCAQREEP